MNTKNLSFPENMPDIHKKLYLENLQQIQQNEKNGWNLGYTEHLKNSNFNLINFYLIGDEK